MPEKVVDIDFPQNRLRLSNGQNLSYKALIVADGINSPICKMMNLLDIEKGFCIQPVIGLIKPAASPIITIFSKG